MPLRFFKVSDFACKCDRPQCDAAPVDMTLVMKLDGLRLEFGEAITITSGTRCAYQNAAVGGEPKSQHLLGLAADIACPDGIYLRKLLVLALKQGFTGVGIKTHLLHLDIRSGVPVVFGYS